VQLRLKLAIWSAALCRFNRRITRGFEILVSSPMTNEFRNMAVRVTRCAYLCSGARPSCPQQPRLCRSLRNPPWAAVHATRCGQDGRAPLNTYPCVPCAELIPIRGAWSDAPY
jgi:hypothetical protein